MKNLVRRRQTRWIDDYDPEDQAFWASSGRRIAGRNLVFSIFAENLGFSIWLLWSVVAISLAGAGYGFTVNELFWLIALPNLVGAIMRFPYTFAPARFGGRDWTVVSALLLLVPTGLLAWAVSTPETPFWVFALIAATAGLGGGNFASSMANITHFYPERRQGTALGINAAGGNLGVSIVQLVVPLVIATGGIAYAGLMWLPLIVAAAVCAYLFMDNLSNQRSTFRDQIRIIGRSQTWIMSFLYIGTFGSFIGYSAAFPLLIQTQFPDVSPTRYAFLGALVGSLVRPFGGWLADRVGGARVTFWNFLGMAFGVLAVWSSSQSHSFPLFLAAFLFLFVTSGIGNGSTYRMIPAIFRALSMRRVATAGEIGAEASDGAVGKSVGRGAGRFDETALAGAIAVSRRESAAVLGFCGAVGALGGFFIPRGFGISIASTGGVGLALTVFLVFYLACLSVTWWCYLRRRVAVHLVPSLAGAGV